MFKNGPPWWPDALRRATMGRALKHCRHALIHHHDAIREAVLPGTDLQALEWFVERLVAEAEGAVVHRHHGARAEIHERRERLLRVHVDLAAARRFVGADGQ